MFQEILQDGSGGGEKIIYKGPLLQPMTSPTYTTDGYSMTLTTNPTETEMDIWLEVARTSSTYTMVISRDSYHYFTFDREMYFDHVSLRYAYTTSINIYVDDVLVGQKSVSGNDKSISIEVHKTGKKLTIYGVGDARGNYFRMDSVQIYG